MAHKIFKLLDEYNLLKPKDRAKVISHLSPNEANDLIYKISQVASRGDDKKDAILKLSILYPTIDVLKQIPSYLFLFKKVYVPDPLTDYLQWVGYTPEEWEYIAQESFRLIAKKTPYEELFDLVKKYKQSIEKINLLEIIKAQGIDSLNRLISIYVEYEDLINENVLVPFVDTNLDYANFVDFIPIAMERLVSYTVDNYADKLTTQFKSDWDLLVEKHKDNPDKDFLAEEIARAFFSRQGLALLDIWRFLANTLVFKELFPSSYSENLDFGGDKNKYYIDGVVKMCNDAISTKLGIIPSRISWPTPEDELIFSTLKNIPSSELLLIREKEKDAIEKFQYGMQGKLLDIKKSVGTGDYRDLIKKLRLEQQKQVAEISLLVERIKRDYLRKLAFQISTTTLSAAGAILSATLSTSDPLTILGTGIGSAGFTAGVTKLIETWICFKSEMEKIREKDAYILWKLHK